MVTFMLHAQVTAFNNLVKQVRTPPVRPADGVVRRFYESFVPWGRLLWFWAAAAECLTR